MDENKANKRVGIKDIAKEANTSIASVSLVINGKDNGKVADKVKKRILEAIKKLNYQPNLNARTLKSGDSVLIGLIVPSITNHFYPELIKGIMQRADELGYYIVIFDSENDFAKEEAYVRTLRSISAKGIIIAGVYDDDGREERMFHELKEQGVPLLQVDRFNPIHQLPYVGLDNYQASYEMTKYLLSIGHERIALLMPQGKQYIIEERRRGYEKAMKETDYDIEDGIFYLDAIHFSNLDDCVKNIIESPKRFTAIYDANGDISAIEVIKELRKNDLIVPDDIGVTGFDDVYVSALIKPALTTIRQPKYELGKNAMDLMKQIIDGNNTENMGIQLKGQLIARGSVSVIL